VTMSQMTTKLPSSTVLRVALIVCILASLYCLGGVLQAEWLSATPNFPRQRAVSGLEVWGSVAVVLLVLAGWCGVSLWKRRQN
jgi:hypothetical protein